MDHPSNRLFAAVFGDPTQAMPLLRAALPPEFVRTFDWTSLTRAPEDLVRELPLCAGDLLFTIQAQDCPTPFLLLLRLDDGSRPIDERETVRLVRRIGARFRELQRPGWGVLAILPLVIRIGGASDPVIGVN